MGLFLNLGFFVSGFIVHFCSVNFEMISIIVTRGIKFYILKLFLSLLTLVT